MDIFIGALSENPLTERKFTSSNSYYYNTLTWCVQKKQPIPNWQNILYYCRDPMLYVLSISSSIAALFFIYFIQQFEHFQPKWDWHRLALAGFCLMCGFVSDYKPNNLSNRVFCCFWIYSSMFFIISATCIFIGFMTTNIYENQIRSINEIINNNFELIGDDFALQHLMQQNEVITRVTDLDYSHFWNSY